ncbi:MAG: family 4 glycosyltransferase [Roseibaca calidilacus]|uniref:Family 4 glycosyltransferase n=1 Tax=Roseibaca calidilacus TaxID=1666912 RepID=A0A0P7YY35_9RHOB|nr:glycosyltransferase [Roseibaca calidilacus]KPP95879.1 MAG: family 4 glycosyltransferase [Roseibaca calidilacus]CUX81558.1 Glycosyltransferase involved in cell wall bisynthesis [Roseibaca calidilacus]
MTGRLVIYSSAPAQQRADGLWLDAKFVQGMERHVAEWPGPVSVVLRDAGLPLPFGVHCPPGSLGFDLAIVPRRAAVAPHLGRDVALLAAAADDHEALDFPALAQALGAKLVYVLEYTLGTRLRIVWMDRTRNPLRRARSALWTLQQERRLRRALRVADAVQFNGYPAYDAYRGLVRDAHLYLDNRLSAAMLATAPEMTARAERLRSGAPLRLIHSGRLEPMKGAQDLLPVMDALATRGVDATLDIYGTGSLEGDIRAGLDRFGGRVRLHAPVDFARELVPINRSRADVFLSCHRQSDPSCTYLEAMGCGLAVAGFDNAMWRGVQTRSGGGALAQLGNVAALADVVARWHHDRDALIRACGHARAFAADHEFDGVFSARMAHWRKVAGLAG